MESNYKQTNENIYFACRKKAAIYNERLNSREEAAELLGISPSTLANHELGVTKNVPVDTVVMMADLYRAPELRNHYCKYECPIGKDLPMATSVGSLELITVQLLNEMDSESIESMKSMLLKIASDGQVDDSELHAMNGILKKLDGISEITSQLKMLIEKCNGKEQENGTCRET